ncbi:MAG: RtcB family protein [Halobacteriota archaeon]|nr:RtcB family protein [Halobacteriota archaeon]
MEIPIKKVRDDVWEISSEYKPFMRVPARLYASKELLDKIKTDLTIRQAINVTSMPGIVRYSLTMPDGHQGYGFPIGGVVACDFDDGVISPGGVGYDINCGVRLIKTDLMEEEVRAHIPQLLDGLFENVPAGLGLSGKLRLSGRELSEVLKGGSEWAVEKGYGWEDDIERTENGGRMKDADPDKVDEKAKKRGTPQLGTLGSGNHFLELQVVDEIFDKKTAERFGIDEVGQVAILLHTGGRGLSHGVCSHYLREFEREMRQDRILSQVLDLERELACAYLSQKVGMDYFQAMCACANYAWANRQLATYYIRKTFEDVLARSAEDMGMHLIYDVAHNIAKMEVHEVDGVKRKLAVHRKGATRAFSSGNEDLPKIYRDVGQPVLVPGSMGTRSFLLLGTNTGKKETFGSCAHGSGREMSRTKATKMYSGIEVKKDLESRGIAVKVRESTKKRRKGPFDRYGELAEEASGAYKNPEVVVNCCETTGIGKRVAAFRAVGVIKG